VSTQAVSGAVSGVPAGELAILQRMQQLQTLIESARQVAAGGQLPTSASTSSGGLGASAGPGASAGQDTGSAGVGANTDFASALQAATTADAYSADGVVPAAELTAGSSGSGAAATGGAGDYEALIEQAAARNGVDPAVLHGLIEQESGFDPSATSSAGAAGLTQLMPGTATSLGVANPLNPAESIEGGAHYLGELTSEFGGDTQDALAAYNAGPGAVEQYGGIPPYAETESYVAKVLGNAETYRQSHPTTALAGSVA
jgi:soluble lytic murein transglycosylase-like protein